MTQDHQFKKQAEIIKRLTKELQMSRSLMFKITDESVPLFGSKRLHNLHRNCRNHLSSLTEGLAFANGTEQS